MKQKYSSNLKSIRSKRKFTQQELGMKFRNPVDLTVISRWERGVVRPSYDNLLELARVLQVDPRKLKFEKIVTD